MIMPIMSMFFVMMLMRLERDERDVKEPIKKSQGGENEGLPLPSHRRINVGQSSEEPYTEAKDW